MRKILLLLVLLIIPVAGAIEYSVDSYDPFTVSADSDITLHIKHASEESYTETGPAQSITPTLSIPGRYLWYIEQGGEQSPKKYFFNYDTNLYEAQYNSSFNTALSSCSVVNGGYECFFEHETAQIIDLLLQKARTSNNQSYANTAFQTLTGNWTTTTTSCNPSEEDFSCKTKAELPNGGSFEGVEMQAYIINSLWDAYRIEPNTTLREYAVNFTEGVADECDIWSNQYDCGADTHNAMYAAAMLKAYEVTDDSTYREKAQNLYDEITTFTSPEAIFATAYGMNLGLTTQPLDISQVAYPQSQTEAYFYTEAGKQLRTQQGTIDIDGHTLATDYIGQRLLSITTLTETSIDHDTILRTHILHDKQRFHEPYNSSTVYIDHARPQIGESLPFVAYHHGPRNNTFRYRDIKVGENGTAPLSPFGTGTVPVSFLDRSRFMSIDIGKTNTTVSIPLETQQFNETTVEAASANPRRFCAPFNNDYTCNREEPQYTYAQAFLQPFVDRDAEMSTLLTTIPGNTFTTCGHGIDFQCESSGVQENSPLFRAGTLIEAYSKGYIETGNGAFYDKAQRYAYETHNGVSFDNANPTGTDAAQYVDGLLSYVYIAPDQAIEQQIPSLLPAGNSVQELQTRLNAYQYNTSYASLSNIQTDASALLDTCTTSGTCEPTELYAQMQFFWDLYRVTQNFTYYSEAFDLSLTQPDTEQNACNPNTANQVATGKYRCLFPEEQGTLINAFTAADHNNVILDPPNVTTSMTMNNTYSFHEQYNVSCYVKNIDDTISAPEFSVQLLSDQTIDNITVDGNATPTVQDSRVTLNSFEPAEEANVTFTVNMTRGGKDTFTCNIVGGTLQGDATITEIGEAATVNQTQSQAYYLTNFTSTYTLANTHPFPLQNVTITSTVPIDSTTGPGSLNTSNVYKIPVWQEDSSQQGASTNITLTLKHDTSNEGEQQVNLTVQGAYGVTQNESYTVNVTANNITTTTPHPDSLKLFTTKNHTVTVKNDNPFDLPNLTITPSASPGINVTITNNGTTNTTLTTSLLQGEQRTYNLTYTYNEATTSTPQLQTRYEDTFLNVTRTTTPSITRNYVQLSGQDTTVDATRKTHTVDISSTHLLNNTDVLFEPESPVTIFSYTIQNVTRLSNVSIAPTTANTTQDVLTNVSSVDGNTIRTDALTVTTNTTDTIRGYTVYSPNTTTITPACELTPPSTFCPTTQHNITFNASTPFTIDAVLWNSTTSQTGPFATKSQDTITFPKLFPSEPRTVQFVTETHQSLPKDIAITAESEKGAYNTETVTLSAQPTPQSGEGDDSGSGGGSGGGGGGGTALSDDESEPEEPNVLNFTYTVSTQQMFELVSEDIYPPAGARRRLQPLSDEPCFEIQKQVTQSTPYTVNISFTSCLSADTYTVWDGQPGSFTTLNMTRPQLQKTYETDEAPESSFDIIPRIAARRAPDSDTELQTDSTEINETEPEEETEETNSSEVKEPSTETKTSTAEKITQTVLDPTVLIGTGSVLSLFALMGVLFKHAERKGTFTKAQLGYIHAKDAFKEEFSHYKEHHQRLTPAETIVLSMKLRVHKVERYISEERWDEAQDAFEEYTSYVDTHTNSLQDLTKRGEKQLDSIAERTQSVIKALETEEVEEAEPVKDKKEEEQDEEEKPAPSIYLKLQRALLLLAQKKYDDALSVLDEADEEAEDIEQLYPEESAFLKKRVEDITKRVEQQKEADPWLTFRQKKKELYEKATAKLKELLPF